MNGEKRRRKHKTRKGFTFSDSETESSDGSTGEGLEPQANEQRKPSTRSSLKKRDKRTKQDRNEDITSSESDNEEAYPSDADAEDEEFFTVSERIYDNLSWAF
jgi:hypothetical protein